MPSETFKLISVTRVLADGVELAEALAFPEISALGGNAREWQAALQTKAKDILEDAALSPPLFVHRRHVSATPEVGAVELVLEPPRRTPDWQQPVTLNLAFVRWEEGDLHHAFVPALGIQVFATRAALLEERVKEHARLVLVGLRKRITLQYLVDIAREERLELSTLEVTANIKTPKQLAEAVESEAEKSVLSQMAEELPPLISASEAREPAPIAFEIETELQLLAEAMAGPHRRSVLLVGPPGCGKTALVQEFARRRKQFEFAQTRFWSTSGARLMAGPIGFGMWQERCQKMCQEAKKTAAILHLGNLGELLEVGKVRRDQQSVGGFLRQWIARAEVLAIAECTPEQLGPIELQDPHLLGCFQQMQIAERSAEQTRIILDRVLESAPGKSSSVPPAALDRLHALHSRYATYSANPGRPVRFLKNLLADRFPEKSFTEAEVTASFSRETGLPDVLLDDTRALDLDATRSWFSRRVIGQTEAVERITDLLAVIKTRLARPRKPLGSLLFIGPTGTGKTELAKALAEFLFSDANRVTRFDLNEFGDSVAVQRLVGVPGGDEGLLTARIREQPFNVLLLDEFEKAHASFFDLLLQVLGDGRLTDSAGRVADFCNCVVVMTSNLGAQGFQRGPAGFRAVGASAVDATAHFTDAVQKFLRPEIFNRLDAIVPFQPLGRETVHAIAERQLSLLQQREGLRLRPLRLEFSSEVAAHLAERGYDARYGARPLKRTLERELVTPLSERLNEYSEAQFLAGRIAVKDGRLCVELRALEPTRDEATAAASSNELTAAIVSQRRLAARLKNCSAASAIENQITMLETLERLATKAKWKSEEHYAKLSRLPKFRACLSAIEALHARAMHLETEALCAAFKRERLEHALFSPELNAIDRDRQKVLRELFRLSHDHPDDIVLAVFSEHRDMLFEIAHAYTEAGELAAFDYFLPSAAGRARGLKPVRETPTKVADFFLKRPERVIGVVMHLRGDLFGPRFGREAGLHIRQEKESEQICLIETTIPPFAAYEPPAGIERQGTVKSLGRPVCRRFNAHKRVVIDMELGERPWSGSGFVQIARELTEERLGLRIKAVTN